MILDTNALSSLAGKDARLVARLRSARRVVVTNEHFDNVGQVRRIAW